MKTMAEVIMLHSPIGRDEDGQYCKGCNHRYGYAADRQLHQRASVHIAQELVAAGYGPVREAQGAELKRIRGELKTLGKNLDSWESQEHATVTIRHLRSWLARLAAQ